MATAKRKNRKALKKLRRAGVRISNDFRVDDSAVHREGYTEAEARYFTKPTEDDVRRSLTRIDPMLVRRLARER